MATRPPSSETATLLAEAERFDGYPALSEHKFVRVSGSVDSRVEHMVADDSLVGLAVAARHRAADDTSHWAVEAVVDPKRRSPDAEREILRRAANLVPRGEPHTIWAWRPAQVAALNSLGYRPIRHILRLERSLPIEPVAKPSDGPGLTRFVPGFDEEELIAANNRAFAGHPEDGNLTSAGLAERMGRDWFDPRGILLARWGSDVVGFCWTKFQQPSLGEIYVIGVVPEERGRGVGSRLLQAGLVDLHDRGADRAMLWVESDNGPARALYARLGFRPVLGNTEFAEPGTQPKR